MLLDDMPRNRPCDPLSGGSEDIGIDAGLACGCAGGIGVHIPYMQHRGRGGTGMA
jgi:hypothetical protein